MSDAPRDGLHDDDALDASHMNGHSAHDDVSERVDVAGAALRALAPTEQNDVEALAARDPRVAAELAAMENVVAELSRVVPPLTMNRGRSAGIRSRLMARANDEHRRPASSSARPAERPAVAAPPRPAATVTSLDARRERAQAESAGARRRSFPLGTLLAAAAIVIAAGLGTNWWLHSRSDVAPTTVATADTTTHALDSMRAELAKRDSMIASLTGPGTHVIDLAAAAPGNDARARVFWNQRTDKWMMFATRLPKPPAGRTWELWMIARGHPAPIPGGTFMPDSNGNAEMVTTAPLPPGALRALAITDEPMGGSPTPTGERLATGVGR